MRTEAVLALDVGGGHVTAGMVRRTDEPSGRSVVGKVVRRSIPPDSSGPELLTAWAACAMDAVANQSVAAVGIAVPAPFDYDRGVSRAVHKFASLSGVDVGAGLAQRWSRSPMADAPVVFGNDADLWTLGEAVAGEARGFRRIIGLTLGTGLGSGFVVEGRIVRSGPEIPPDGELWNIPFGDGIAEDRASGRAIATAYVRQTGCALDAAAIAAAARSGDAAASAVFAVLGADLAALVAPWVRSFSANVVVLGGNVSRAFDLFGPTLAAGLEGAAIVRCTVGFETSTLLGAAELADPLRATPLRA